MGPKSGKDTPKKSGKRRKVAVSWQNNKGKKQPKVAEKAAVVKAAEKAAAADTEDDVPPPPASPVAPFGADAPGAGADAASSALAAASVGLTLASPSQWWKVPLVLSTPRRLLCPPRSSQLLVGSLSRSLCRVSL